MASHHLSRATIRSNFKATLPYDIRKLGVLIGNSAEIANKVDVYLGSNIVHRRMHLTESRLRI